MTNKLSKQNAILENAFDVLNQKYYDGKLPETIITIQRTPKYHGHFTIKKIWKEKGSEEEHSFHEINLGAESLNRSIVETLATLNHEMVHLYCSENDIKDTSNNHRYHNKKFKTEAEKRGLIIEHAKSIGWSVTTPTDEFSEFCKNNFKEEDFLFYCEKQIKKSASSKSFKYTCPECGAIARATKQIHIKCGECEVDMEVAN